MKGDIVEIAPQRTIEQRVESLEVRVDRREKLPERRDKLEQQILLLRGEMHEQFSTVHEEMHVLHHKALAHSDKRHDEAMAQSRMMFEELIGRIKGLGEGRDRV